MTRQAIGRLLRRSAAYGADILILAMVLIPLAFAIQAMTGYRPESGIGLQLGLLWVVYGSLAAYLIVALRNGGERSIHDLAAGSTVRFTAA